MIDTKTVIDQWIRFIRRMQSPGTAHVYNRVIHQFQRFVPADYETLSWQHIEAWMDYCLVDRHCCKNTVDGYMAVVRSFCHWVASRYEVANPATKVGYLVKKKDRRWVNRRIITQVEYEQITAVARGLLLDAVQFIAHTGVRSSEFRALTWEAFSNNWQTMTVIGKGNRQRSVPTDNAICQEIIRRHLGCTDIPFVVEFSHDDLQLLRTFHRLADRVGIPHFGPHALRHYYCTSMIEDGVPLKIVSEILGHVNTTITEEVYTHLTKQSVMGWSSRMDYRARKKAGP